MSFTNHSQKLNEQLEKRLQVLDAHLQSDVHFNAANLRLNVSALVIGSERGSKRPKPK